MKFSKLQCKINNPFIQNRSSKISIVPYKFPSSDFNTKFQHIKPQQSQLYKIKFKKEHFQISTTSNNQQQNKVPVQKQNKQQQSKHQQLNNNQKCIGSEYKLQLYKNGYLKNQEIAIIKKPQKQPKQFVVFEQDPIIFTSSSSQQFSEQSQQQAKVVSVNNILGISNRSKIPNKSAINIKEKFNNKQDLANGVTLPKEDFTLSEKFNFYTQQDVFGYEKQAKNTFSFSNFQSRQIQNISLNLQPNKKDYQFYKIPELPEVTKLEFTLVQNWGHLNMIGLNGIQIFNDEGQQILPLFIESNSGDSEDNLDKIFNGKNYTRCINYSWSSKWNSQAIKLIVYFQQKIKISLIRVWNYSHKIDEGVKFMLIKSQQQILFNGQIRKRITFDDYQNILFTNDNNIITQIQKYDWLTKIQSDFLNTQQQRGIQTGTRMQFQILENHGHKLEFGFHKIKLYDELDAQIPFSIQQMPIISYSIIYHKILHIKTQRNRVVKRMEIHNLTNDKAIKQMIIKFNECKQYVIENILKINYVQKFILSKNVRYSNLIKQAFTNTNMISYKNIIFGNKIKIIIKNTWNSSYQNGGFNKIQIYDYFGLPLLKSKHSYYQIFINQIPHHFYFGRIGEFQPFKKDLITSPKNNRREIELEIFFNDFLAIGAVCIWNKIQNENASAKQIIIEVQDMIIYQGYLAKSNKNDQNAFNIIKFCHKSKKLSKYHSNELQVSKQINLINEGKKINKQISRKLFPKKP